MGPIPKILEMMVQNYLTPIEWLSLAVVIGEPVMLLCTMHPLLN